MKKINNERTRTVLKDLIHEIEQDLYNQTFKITPPTSGIGSAQNNGLHYFVLRDRIDVLRNFYKFYKK